MHSAPRGSYGRALLSGFILGASIAACASTPPPRSSAPPSASSPTQEVNEVGFPDGGRYPLIVVNDTSDFSWPADTTHPPHRLDIWIECDLDASGAPRNCVAPDEETKPLKPTDVVPYLESKLFAREAAQAGSPQHLVFLLKLRSPAAGSNGGSPDPSNDVEVDFNEHSLTKPTVDLDRSSRFHWLPDQMRSPVRELVLVQCAITAEGRLKRCRILKHGKVVTDRQVFDYCDGLVFHPAVRADGRPAAIRSFTIPLRLRNDQVVPPQP